MTAQNGSKPELVDEHVHLVGDPPCPGCGWRILTTGELTSLHEKLDKIIEFQSKLEPFFPLLARVSAMLDNPAARFRDVARFRKGMKETP